MPPLPPGLSEWFTPGIIVAVAGLLLNQLASQVGKRIDSLEATTNRRFDELQKDQNRRFNEQDKKLDELRTLMELLRKAPPLAPRL